ncbi:MAG: hypothetical protein ACLP07_01595 [Terracidiphilus sp.]
MPTPVNRRTVDLSAYPDLVVVYLGMRVNRLTGLKTLFGFGPQNHEVCRRSTRRPAPPLELHVLALPHAQRHGSHL